MEELNAITRKEKFLAKAAGQDVETPEPITREEMFLSKIAGGGGGGGASSWNDLKDKPFGEETVSIGDTMTFPEKTPISPTDVFVTYGELAGATVGVRRVSENIPTKDILIGGTFELHDDESVNISEDMIMEDTEVLAVLVDGMPLIAVVLADNATTIYEGITFYFAKRGVYIGCAIPGDLGYYINMLRSITLPGYNFTKEVVNPIDEKFLPDTVATKADIFGAMEASY